MKAFFNYEYMITPGILKILSYIAAVVVVIMGLFALTADLTAGISMIVLGPIAVRIYAELMLIVFEMHKDKMQIKNANVAIANLEKIFTATFKLANSKGLQAMSLRDLSKETGISMGGLYAYIESKDDLASVIEGVQRQYIDKVIGGLTDENLEPIDCLRAIIFGEIYMMEIMSPWYYFCFMELKGLSKEQQQFALNVELRFEDTLMESISEGVEAGLFTCDKPELLASQVTAQLQQ